MFSSRPRCPEIFSAACWRSLSQACSIITAAVASLHARLQAAAFWAWTFLSPASTHACKLAFCSHLSLTRITKKQAASRKAIHPAMQSLSQVEFPPGTPWARKDAGCAVRLARQGWFNGMGPLSAAQALTNISKSDQKAKERCLNLSSKKLNQFERSCCTTKLKRKFENDKNMGILWNLTTNGVQPFRTKLACQQLVLHNDKPKACDNAKAACLFLTQSAHNELHSQPKAAESRKHCRHWTVIRWIGQVAQQLFVVWARTGVEI